MRFTTTLALLAFTAPALAQTTQPADPAKGLSDARLVGWQMTSSMIEGVARGDISDWPAIGVWIEQWNAFSANVDENNFIETWPQSDIDTLVCKNPKFWAAHYDIAPGDPGMHIIHAGLLMTAGELMRAADIISFAEERPGVPKGILDLYPQIRATCASGKQPSEALVVDGIALFDANDYDGAMKKYDAALAMWPQNAWAHYERGLTLNRQANIAAGKEPTPMGNIVVNPSVNTPKAAEVAFAKTRYHDPFRIRAYQGSNKDVIEAFMVLADGLPIWEKLRDKTGASVSDDELMKLADICQQCDIHEFALVIRGVVIGRRGRYDPSDYPFIKTSLEALIGAEDAAPILKKIAGERLLLKQLIPPVATQPSDAGE